MSFLSLLFVVIRRKLFTDDAITVVWTGLLDVGRFGNSTWPMSLSPPPASWPQKQEWMKREMEKPVDLGINHVSLVVIVADNVCRSKAYANVLHVMDGSGLMLLSCGVFGVGT